jgi:2-amino-4-hydroxy-6-hydroxymethyldihydropteridine diphosphokinase
LLLFGAATVSSARLELPHPRMLDRAFVLLPLAQIAPEHVPAAALAALTSQVITPIPSGPGD